MHTCSFNTRVAELTWIRCSFIIKAGDSTCIHASFITNSQDTDGQNLFKEDNFIHRIVYVIFNNNVNIKVTLVSTLPTLMYYICSPVLIASTLIYMYYPGLYRVRWWMVFVLVVAILTCVQVAVACYFVL